MGTHEVAHRLLQALIILWGDFSRWIASHYHEHQTIYTFLLAVYIMNIYGHAKFVWKTRNWKPNTDGLHKGRISFAKGLIWPVDMLKISCRRWGHFFTCSFLGYFWRSLGRILRRYDKTARRKY